MFVFRKLNHKLITVISAVALIPLSVFAFIGVTTATDALKVQVFHQLDSIRAIKQSQVTDYVQSVEASLTILRDDPFIVQALNEFLVAFDAAGDRINDGEWNRLAADYGSRVADITKAQHWYDFFFIDTNGIIIYSNSRQSDLGLTIPNSDFRDSGIGQIFRKVKGSAAQSIALSDFSPYKPSNNEPAAFMMTAITDKKSGSLRGYIALEVPLAKINEIMQQREGMGEAGESYLVGPDKRMRSDPYLTPGGHSANASFAGTVTQNGVDNTASNVALAGKSGSGIIIDYNGNPVLSSFGPIPFGDKTWALLAEIDEAEAFPPANKLKRSAVILLLFSAVIIVVIGILVAGKISSAITRVADLASAVAEGDLTVDIVVTEADEIGILQTAMQSMVKRLHTMVAHISSSAQQHAAAVYQLAVITEETQKTYWNNIELQIK